MITREPWFRQWALAPGARLASAASMALAVAMLAAVLLLADALAAQSAGPADTVVIFEAGSLVAPIGAVAAGFTARTGIAVRTESGGSLDQARKLTIHDRIPDIIALADADLIPPLLIPRYARWYARFASNRMVIAYSDRARGAAEMSDSTWWKVLTSPGVRAGRSDPDLDPGGYRAVIATQLAEQYYRQPDLARRLLAHSLLYSSFPSPARPDSLLHSGDLDYLWTYESYALEKGLRFQRLPSAVDLGNPADSVLYASVSRRVAGATPRDTITVRGARIVYGLTVPERAPHRAAAERFVTYLLSPEGQSSMRAAHMELLIPPRLLGDVPSAVRVSSGTRPRAPRD